MKKVELEEVMWKSIRFNTKTQRHKDFSGRAVQGESKDISAVRINFDFFTGVAGKAGDGK